MVFGYQNSQLTLFYYFTSAPTSDLYFKVTVVPPASAVLKKNPGTGALEN
jgi:hypothetical protein